MIKTMLISLFIIGLLSGWFYWFQYRPTEVRRACIKKLKQNLSKMGKNNSYRECLIRQGLKPESIFEVPKSETTINEIDNSYVEDSIDNLRYSLENSLEEQKQDIQDEFQNSANCESNSGRYMGNGLCVYY